jgi:hemerythrin-like domain-containing protein
MSAFNSHVCRRLYEEHAAVFDLCRRLEQSLARQATAPAGGDTEWTALLSKVEGAIEQEVWKHFEFEEKSLWPLLHDCGDGDLATLLDEEHGVIREAAAGLTSGIAMFRAGTLTQPEWLRMKTAGLEFCERLVSHAQKEDLSLLPALDNLLTPEQDNELFGAYAMA